MDIIHGFLRQKHGGPKPRKNKEGQKPQKPCGVKTGKAIGDHIKGSQRPPSIYGHLLFFRLLSLIEFSAFGPHCFSSFGPVMILAFVFVKTPHPFLKPNPIRLQFSSGQAGRGLLGALARPTFEPSCF